ncbi:MAG TPA: translation initiation factor IF-2 [Acidimicrobiia bacterium]|nr:translation initiation factor IF-2 [Acidimicrobiia bacterium]
MRVHQIAKELGLASKDAVDMLTKLGVDVRNHASTIEDADAAKLRGLVKNGSATPATPAPAPRAAAAPAPAPRAPAPPVAPAPRGPSAPPAPRPQPVASPAPAPAPAAAPAAPAPAAPAASEIIIPRGVSVTDFAGKIGKSPTDVIKMLMRLGEMKTITQSLSDDEVEVLANEFDVPVRIVSVADDVSVAPEDEAPGASEEEVDAALETRPPVVTVMGHVDHGKSSILQQFRKKEMLSLEAGGITQAIGAYQVHGKDGLATTFIDTPGHEAFTQMRARGAQVTDVAILVVAADDGVQPQTVEALDHAKAAKVPVLVAVNKIDRPEADPTRVRQQLSELGLTPDEWGGDTVFVDVSAKAGTNLDVLLDMIHLVAEMQNLKANPNVPARGHAIEAHLDRGRGPVATLIVQKGTLRPGQAVVCGAAWARVRTMLDENGHSVPKAGPAQPVQVSGWSRLPAAGDEFFAVKDEREAKRISQEREARQRAADFVAGAKPATLEDLLFKTRTGDVPELRLILKADTQGSLEALTESLTKMHRANLRLNILRRGVGAIGESDVTLAQASDAIVVGFGVRPDAGARQLAEREGVDVRTYQVIYQLLDDISQALKGLLAPEEQEFVLGSAQVRATFRIPRAVVAGCYVTEGKVVRGARARLVRDGTVTYTGRIATLRRFKEDAREVATGFECGITLEDFNDVKEGDVIEDFEVREVVRD